MKGLTFVLLVLVWRVGAFADLYTPGAGFSGVDPYYTMGSNTLPDNEGNGAGIWLKAGPLNDAGSILRIDDRYGGTAGIGHVWYETVEETAIDAAFTADATPFYSIVDPLDFSVEIQMNYNQPFIVAFWLVAEGPMIADVYGWAELMFDGSTVHLLDSAAENSGVGIIAGRHIAVPEPSSALIFVLGSGGLFLCFGTTGRRFLRAERIELGRPWGRG